MSATVMPRWKAAILMRPRRHQGDLGADLQAAIVLADASLLDDLLSNLVDNALKYTPAGGSVTVYAGERDGHPYLAVEDSGPGIPEADRQKVRQRFLRLPNSPGHGSGLGLAIVEEIADALWRRSSHRFRIQSTRHPGHGTLRGHGGGRIASAHNPRRAVNRITVP